MSNIPENNQNPLNEPEQLETGVNSNGNNNPVEYDEELLNSSTVFAAPNKADTKPKAKLKPATRGLIISAIAIVLTAAIALTVWLVPYTEQEYDPISSATQSWTVVNVAESKVDSLNVHNKNGSFNIYVPESKKSTSSAASSAAASSQDTTVESYDWCVKGYEDYNLTGAMYLLQSSINIKASKQFTAVEGEKLADDIVGKVENYSFEGQAGESNDKSVYGFTQPYAVIDVNCIDESESYSVIIGSYAPDKSGRYVTITGDSHVYVVPDSNFSLGRYSFDTTVADLVYNGMFTPVTENESNSQHYSEGTLVSIDSLTLSGTCRNNKLVVEPAPEDLSAIAFVVTKPNFRAGNDDNIGEIVDVFSEGLFANGAYVLGYSADDLNKFGLNNPYSKIEVKIGDFTTSLTFGAPIDNYYPCIVSGSDIIYKIAVDEFEWIKYGDKELYFDSLFLEFIANISQITVETEQKSVVFDLVRENKNDGVDFDVSVPDYEELEIDTKEFCYYYSRILSLSAEEYTTDKIPTDSPYISFKIKYIDSNKGEDVIELHRYSTRRYYYTLNGKGDALVKASVVQDLHNCLDLLLAGEKIGRAN